MSFASSTITQKGRNQGGENQERQQIDVIKLK